MTNQRLLKQYFLSSKTAIWSSPETFIEKYVSVYGREPLDTTVQERGYI